MQKKSIFSTWREYARIKNEQMTARRKQFNGLGITLLIVWSLVTVGAACVCMAINFEQLWWLALLCFLATASGVFVFIVLKKKTDYYEAVDELERLSYLFKNYTLEDGETLEVEGLEEDGADFVLSKAGIRLKLREGSEQVFGDGMDEGKFYDWENLDLFLASSNEFGRINLGLAVMSKPSEIYIDGEEVPPQEELFYILPMCKNLALALRTFCFDKLEMDWLYVFYQPLDAFLQIMKMGRIERFIDRTTGEELSEEDFETKNDE